MSRLSAACWRLAPEQTTTGGNWLFYSARTPRDLHYKADWEALCGAGKLHLHAAFSREGARVRFDGNALCFEAAPARRIDEEMLEPQTAEQLWALAEAGAYFYVCGRTGFARTVMQAMQTILARRDGAAAGRERFYRLVGEDRYLQEIFTTYPGAQFEQRRLYTRQRWCCTIARSRGIGW